MTGVKAKRGYSSELRRRQALATRRAVLSAARELFLEQGYGRTTLDQVASRAGVSKPTVFSSVGNKQQLFKEVRDIAIAGDDDPAPVARRPEMHRIRTEPHLDKAAHLVAQHLVDVARRYAKLYDIMRAAAANGEPELQQLWTTEEEQRMTGARHWVELLATKDPSRKRRDLRQRSDIMWFLMAPDHYLRFVVDRGWSESRFQDWLATQIIAISAPPGATAVR